MAYVIQMDLNDHQLLILNRRNHDTSFFYAAVLEVNVLKSVC